MNSNTTRTIEVIDAEICGGLISSDRSIGGQSGIDEEKR